MRIFLISVLWTFCTCCLHAQSLSFIHLQCEHRYNPLGVEAAHPQFSWELACTQRNCRQTACQVQVAADSLFTSLVWDSQRISNSEPGSLRYAGNALLSAHTYFWRAQVWDNHGNTTGWSKAAGFTTGLYNPASWQQARWIGYANLPDSMRVVPGVPGPAKSLGSKALQRTVVPLFRKEFTISKKLSRATVFICGLGQYEMHINGQKAGDAFLSPGWTHYDKRCLYNTYDITALLNSGSNAIGVIVGNGFYNINRERYFKLAVAYGLPKLLCRVQLNYADGTEQNIVSGTDWKTAASPITFTSMYSGEEYDARLEQAGWDAPQFNDAAWRNAEEVAAPKGILEAEKDYPVRVNEVFEHATITHPAPGISVYDFGQNASGIVEVTLVGKKGQFVKLVPAELLTDNGLANQKATGKPYYFTYILKDGDTATWRPRFTYYGFRYVQVETGTADSLQSPGAPALLNVRMLHTGNAAPEVGSFECSSDLFNRINQLIRWAIKSNLQSVATDCPHREKLGWLEEDYLMGGSIHFNTEVQHLFKKIVYDMMDAQTPEGLVPDIAPEYVFFDDHGFGFRDSPEWGSNCILLPWLLYKWYGDTATMRAAYPMMNNYLHYLQQKSVNHMLAYGLGDWFDLGPQRPSVSQLTPPGVTATATWYHDLRIMGKMAALLNDAAMIQYTDTLSAAVKKAYNERFFNRQTNVYASGSQTAMAMSLSLGLVPEKSRHAVFRNLVDSIRLNGKQLTAGDIGFHFLIQALHEGGASQLIYEMNNRDDVPGYGYQLKKGATALTESWQALKEVSNNHLMLGHIMEWLYAGMAGIQQAEHSVAYREIIIRPEPVGDITHAAASYHTPQGNVVSNWKKDNHSFTLQVQVPVNTTAAIYLPATKRQTLLESGAALKKQGIRKAAYRDGRAIVNIGSGNYTFTVSD